MEITDTKLLPLTLTSVRPFHSYEGTNKLCLVLNVDIAIIYTVKIKVALLTVDLSNHIIESLNAGNNA